MWVGPLAKLVIEFELVKGPTRLSMNSIGAILGLSRTWSTNVDAVKHTPLTL